MKTRTANGQEIDATSIETDVHGVVRGFASFVAPNSVSYSIVFVGLPPAFERVEYELGISSRSVVVTIFRGHRMDASTVVVRYDVNAPITQSYLRSKTVPQISSDEAAWLADVIGTVIGRG